MGEPDLERSSLPAPVGSRHGDEVGALARRHVALQDLPEAARGVDGLTPERRAGALIEDPWARPHLLDARLIRPLFTARLRRLLRWTTVKRREVSGDEELGEVGELQPAPSGGHPGSSSHTRQITREAARPPRREKQVGSLHSEARPKKVPVVIGVKWYCEFDNPEWRSPTDR